MRVRSLALAVLLVVTVFAGIGGTSSDAWAAEPVPGGACTTSNLIVTTGGPETSGVRRVMRCNGSTWQQEMTIDAAGKTGIGTDSPAAPLHVGGEAIIGQTTGIACGATTTGGLRWSSANSTFEMCDGSSWRLLTASAPAGCTGPSAFSFTNATGQSLGVLVTSNTITPSGCATVLGVTVSGGGTPQISINGGPWTTSGSISPGQTIAVRLTSSGAVGTTLSAVVVIGSTTGTTWTVTTRSAQLLAFRTNNAYLGSAIGSLSNADALCQSEAGALGYAGNYKAIMSDETTNAKDRLTLSYPIVDASNNARTISASNLWIGSLTNPFNIYGGWGYRAWTGTDVTGNKISGSTCNNWTGGTNGETGFSEHGDTAWIDSAPIPCTSAVYLYCIQQ